MDKEKLIKRYSKLKQYRDKSPEELEKIAIRKLEEEELKTYFVGLMDAEIDKAISLYYKYIDENSFENLAEKTTLINLVYLETLKERMQSFIKKESEEKAGAIDLRMTEQLLNLDSQILELKEKLGMLKGEKEDSIVKRWEELKEKCLKYYEEHAAEFYNKCPYCNKLFPSILPPDKLDPQTSSWFKGTTLYNKETFDLYHKKRITIEEAARILGVSKNYIEFMYTEIYLKEQNDN